MITIIVPVYNIEKYLSECIDSILQQTFNDFELVLVDDGSVDNSGSICDAFAKKDKRISVLHKKNGGLSAARNSGLDIANGEYVCFIDGDDAIAPNFLEVLIQGIEMKKCDMAICGFHRFSDYKSINIENDEKSFVVSREAYWKSTIPDVERVVAWNKLYKRFLFESVRYPEGKLHEDEFIIHKIVENCSSIWFTSNHLYFYRQREQSITSKVSTNRLLDRLDAFIDRMLFYYGLSKSEIAILAMFKAFHSFALIKKQGDRYLYKIEIRTRKKLLKKYSFKLLFKCAGIKKKLRLLVFIISSSLYEKVYIK